MKFWYITENKRKLNIFCLLETYFFTFIAFRRLLWAFLRASLIVTTYNYWTFILFGEKQLYKVRIKIKKIE